MRRASNDQMGAASSQVILRSRGLQLDSTKKGAAHQGGSKWPNYLVSLPRSSMEQRPNSDAQFGRGVLIGDPLR